MTITASILILFSYVAHGVSHLTSRRRNERPSESKSRRAAMRRTRTGLVCSPELQPILVRCRINYIISWSQYLSQAAFVWVLKLSLFKYRSSIIDAYTYTRNDQHILFMKLESCNKFQYSMVRDFFHRLFK